MAAQKKQKSEWKDLSTEQKAQLQQIRSNLTRPDLGELDQKSISKLINETLQNIRASFKSIRQANLNKHKRFVTNQDFSALIKTFTQNASISTAPLICSLLTVLLGHKHKCSPAKTDPDIGFHSAVKCISALIKKEFSPRSFKQLLVKLSEQRFSRGSVEEPNFKLSEDDFLMNMCREHLSSRDNYKVALRAMMHLKEVSVELQARWICDAIFFLPKLKFSDSSKEFGGIGGWKGWESVKPKLSITSEQLQEWIADKNEISAKLREAIRGWTNSEFTNCSDFSRLAFDIQPFVDLFWDSDTTETLINKMLTPDATYEDLDSLERVLKSAKVWITTPENQPKLDILSENCTKHGIYAPSLDYLMKRYRPLANFIFEEWSEPSSLGKRVIQQTEIELRNTMYFSKGTSVFLIGTNAQRTTEFKQISGPAKSPMSLHQLEDSIKAIYEGGSFGSQKHFKPRSSYVMTDPMTYTTSINRMDGVFRPKLIFEGLHNQLTIYKGENNPNRSFDFLLVADQSTGNVRLVNPRANKVLGVATPEQIGYQDMLPMESHKCSVIHSPKLGILSKCNLEFLDGQTQLYSWKLRKALPKTIVYDSSYNVRIKNGNRLFVYTPQKCSVYSLDDMNLIEQVTTSIKAPSFGIPVSSGINLVNEEKWAMVILHHLKPDGQSSHYELRSFSDDLGRNMSTWNEGEFPPLSFCPNTNRLSFGYKVECNSGNSKIFQVSTELVPRP